MTYKELIQEVWNNHIKPLGERKRYEIINHDYKPLDSINFEEFGVRKATWESFGVGMLREGGWLEIISHDYKIAYEDSIKDLIIFCILRRKNTTSIVARYDY